MAYLIFPAGPEDAEELGRVHVAAWRETYRGLLPEAYLARMSAPAHARRFRLELGQDGGPTMAVLAVAERDGLAGYAAGGWSRTKRPSEGEIHTLYLLRQAQGRGLGRRLVTGMARVLGAAGAQSLLISVLRDNVKARGFYERLGGVADAPRAEPGPGGVTYEVDYRWPDIAALARR